MTATETLTGSVRTLMKWFSPPTEVCGADDDFEREALLGAIGEATAVATYPARKELLVAASCRAMLTAFDHEGSPLVDVDVVVEDWPGIEIPGGGRLHARRYRFWMNVSSLADLGRYLLPRVSPDAIFIGAKVA